MRHSGTAQSILRALDQADRQLEARHPWLRHQDALGLAIFLFSFLGMLAMALLYLQGLVSGWIVFFVNALLCSFLHELEHDLIHSLYFRQKTWVQDILYAGIWLFHGNTISPWYRKRLHLHHHRESGTQVDIEERLIGNGMPWGWRRFLITFDNVFVAILLFPRLKKEIPEFNARELARARGVIGFSYSLVWVAFLAHCFSHGILGRDLWSPSIVYALNFLMIAFVGPNILRQFCLAFISSNCHYYGIERMNLLQQCQILNHWIFYPLQLFCFNFGSTHVIHHFFVQQSFFRRQMIAAQAHRILRESGVRQNDLESIVQANAYSPAP